MVNEKIVEQFNFISKANVKQCMKCGKCSGRCPVFNQMDIKPHQFISKLAEGNIPELLRSKSILYCLSCMACVERCPRNVAPYNVIETIRTISERLQGGDNIVAEDIPKMIDEDVPQQLLVSAFRKYKK